jgi:methionyl-tRNA formyltransferase
VPLKKFAKTLGLPIHQTENFTELDRSKLPDVNLVIAVSFGLLIPARIINLAQFGGLNVHASLLPEYAGPQTPLSPSNSPSLRGGAPIHHALLLNRPYTGVSVQTLHPTKFDHGVIIDQTALPGIPVPPDVTTLDLEAVLSAEGARLLQGVVKSRAFVQPAPIVHSKDTIQAITGGKGLAKAPKLSKEDSRIDWTRMTASQILLRLRVFGKVWDEVLHRQLGATVPNSRVVYTRLGYMASTEPIPPGTPFVIDNGPDVARIAVRTVDGAVEIIDCTIATRKSTGGAGVRGLVKLLSQR